MRVQRVSLEMLVKLEEEVPEVQWAHQEEMVNEVGLVVMENVEEAVLLEPKESKVILECQDYRDQKVIMVCQVFLVNPVLMDPLESLERMVLRANLVLRVIWVLAGFWDQEVNQDQLANQAFLAWRGLRVQKAPWDLWVGPEILELQDHLDPLVLQVLKVQLVLRVCLALLVNPVYQVFLVLMVYLV